MTSLDGDIDIPEEYINASDIILMGFHKAVVPFSAKDGWQLFAKNMLYPIRLFMIRESAA